MLNRLCAQRVWASPSITENGWAASCAAFWLMAIYLCVLPIGGTIALRNFAFFSLIFLTLWSAWRYRLRLHLPLAAPWLLYGTVALISLTYAVDPLWSLGETKKEVGYGILVVMLAASWVRNLKSLEALIAVLIAGNVVQLGAVLFKCTVLDPFWQHPASEIGLLLYNGAGKSIYNGVGNLSTYLVTVIPLIAAFALLLPREARARRAALFVLLAGDILALFLTNNRMGLLVLMAEILVAVGFLAVTRWAAVGRLLLAAIILLPLLGGLEILAMHVRSPAADPRWQIWAFVINGLLAHPWTGGGFGRTVMVHSNPEFLRVFQLEHAHNMVLNKGVQMGLPGIAAFLLLLGTTLRALWPSRALRSDPRLWGYAVGAVVMSVGVYLKNMTDDFFVEHNALLYWMLVGAVLGALAGHGKESGQRNAA